MVTDQGSQEIALVKELTNASSLVESAPAHSEKQAAFTESKQQTSVLLCTGEKGMRMPVNCNNENCSNFRYL